MLSRWWRILNNECHTALFIACDIVTLSFLVCFFFEYLILGQWIITELYWNSCSHCSYLSLHMVWNRSAYKLRGSILIATLSCLRIWKGLLLIQIMNFRLFKAKPSPEQVLVCFQLGLYLSKMDSKCKHCSQESAFENIICHFVRTLKWQTLACWEWNILGELGGYGCWCTGSLCHQAIN